MHAHEAIATRRLSAMALALTLFAACSGERARDADAGAFDAGENRDAALFSDASVQGDELPATGDSAAEDAAPADAAPEDVVVLPPLTVGIAEQTRLWVRAETVFRLDQGTIQRRALGGQWEPERSRVAAADVSYTVCGIDPDGRLYCGTVTDPVGGAARDVCTRRDNLCVLLTDGQIRCVGATKASVPGGSGYIALSCGSDFACGLGADGRIACPANKAFTLPADTDRVVQLVSTDRMPCWLLETGEVGCGFSSVLELPPGLHAARIAANFEGLCTLSSTGVPSCWGRSGDDLERVRPRPGPFVRIALDFNEVCGETPDGEVACWGGAFGEGPRSERCDLHSAQLSYDGAPLVTSYPLDFSRTPAWSVSASHTRYGATHLNEHAILELPTAYDAERAYRGPQRVLEQAVDTPLSGSTWILNATDDDSGEIICTPAGPGATATRHDDEVLLDLRTLSSLGACPGTPVTGSLRIGDSDQLTGDIAGIPWTHQTSDRSDYTGTEQYPVQRFDDGPTFIAGPPRTDDPARARWALLVTSPESPHHSQVFCVGNARVEQQQWVMSEFSTLGACVAGTHTLTGCIR